MEKTGKYAFSKSAKVFSLLVALYGALVFILPVNLSSQTSLGLGDRPYILLLLALRLPIIVLLCLMFYAYRRMYTYSKSIKDTTEGPHFASITRGLLIMVWGLLAASIISAFLNAYANTTPSFRGTSLIITNYIYVIVTLTTFSYISAGAHRLVRQSPATFTTRQLRWLMFGLVAFGVLFCSLVAGRLSGSGVFEAFNAYYLPNILVWGTIVVPYLFAWFLGFFAAMELLLVAKSTSGIIYRRALQYLAIGLVTFIIAMVVLQYFRSVIPRTGRLALNYTLITTYIIYFLAGVSSIIIARSARRLQKIEEV